MDKVFTHSNFIWYNIKKIFPPNFGLHDKTTFTTKKNDLMKKLLLLFALFAFAQGVRAQGPEYGWVNLTEQTFSDRVTSISVSSSNSLTVAGEFNDTFGTYFSVYDSNTNEFVNTMPAPGIVTCQLFAHGTWYVGLQDAPFAMVWNLEANQWDSFSPAIDSSVYAMCTYKNGIMLGGSFTNHLAFYSFDDLTTELLPSLDDNVFALASSSDSLFIGMGFAATNALQLWNGLEYSSLGIDFQDAGRIIYHGGFIYVTGMLFYNGSLQNRVMRFSQSTGWSELFVTAPWEAAALLWDESSSTLLVGGLFTQIYNQTDTLDVTCPIVGYRNDSIILFPTMFGGAKSITKYNNEIVIVGNFASNVNGPYFPSVYRLTTDTTTTGSTEVHSNSTDVINLFPNPATSYITVSGLPVQKTDLEIYDYLGRRVALYNDVVSMITLDVSNLSDGVYFLKTQNDVAKFIKK